MKIVAPKPFLYEGGQRAVLLLHGFTGTTADVRALGRYLHQRGYTCHAPLYEGHGMEPARLIETSPDDWWRDAVDGYRLLKAEGFDEIAVAGLSLGGVFSLRIGTVLPVMGIVSMCAPMREKSIEDLYRRVRNYAHTYMKFEGKDDELIDSEVQQFERLPMPSLLSLQDLIVTMCGKLDSITSPVFVLQGRLDDPLYQESARFIYGHVRAGHKRLAWYEQSGHLITIGKEREKVFEDVYAFLNSLDWTSPDP